MKRSYTLAMATTSSANARSRAPVPPEAFETVERLPDGAGVVLALPFVLAFWCGVIALAIR